MTLVDAATESRVIATLIFEPDVLPYATELELEDFTDPRHRAVLAAIRNLQARCMVVEMFELDAELRRQDERCGTTVADKAGAAFMADLALSAPGYCHPILWDHDVWWLRELANRRRTSIQNWETAA